MHRVQPSSKCNTHNNPPECPEHLPHGHNVRPEADLKQVNPRDGAGDTLVTCQLCSLDINCLTSIFFRKAKVLNLRQQPGRGGCAGAFPAPSRPELTSLW